MLKRRIEFFPTLLTVFAIIGVWLFILRGKSLEAAMGNELFTHTYEFLLVVVIGSGVSVLFQTVTHGRDVRERRRALQRDIHDALIAAYNDVKRARRLLRARARIPREAPPAAVDSKEYDTQLESISSAQLAIELATRRIEMNRRLFANGDKIIVSLESVAKYVNGIVDEWEETRPRLGDLGAPLALSSVPELDAFLRPYSESPQFRDGFKVPFDRSLELLEYAVASDN